MSSSLTILWSGRRKAVKVGANSPMSAVLADACAAHGLTNTAKYTLFHKKAVVDLTQPFRLSSIPQNTTLELREVAAPSASATVRIGVRLSTGQRLQGSYPVASTLQQVLVDLLTQNGLGADGVDSAVLQFMRTTYAGPELAATTLAAMGLHGGSAMFTVSVGANGSSAPTAAPAPEAPAAALSAVDAAPAAAARPVTPADRPAAAEATEAPESPACPTKRHMQDSPSGSAGYAPVQQQRQQQQQAAPPAAPALAAADEGFEESKASEPPSLSAATLAAATDTVAPMDVAADAPPLLPAVNAATAAAAAVAAAPDVGLEACERALEQLRSSHFDADVGECVVTLIKYVDGVLTRPGEARTRTIKVSNAAFANKVGRLSGGPQFLLGAGFVETAADGAMSHQLAQDPHAHAVLVLPPEREDASLLARARELLCAEARQLGLPPNSIPVARRPSAPSAHAPAPAPFDPFKPLVSSLAPQPKGSDAEPSITERRVAELLAKQRQIEAANAAAFDRELTVTLPGGGTSGGGGGSGGSAAAAVAMDTGDDGGPSDKVLLAQRVARQLAERKREEATPFQTRAMRELERLQKAKAYSHALIRVQLPDRSVVQAKFLPRETVGDVAAAVSAALRAGVSGACPFALYVTPPRRTLAADAVLADEGLVPAALLYLSWQGPAAALIAERGLGVSAGDCLREDLVAAAGGSGGGGDAAAAYPSGLALSAEHAAGQQAALQQGARGGGGGGSGGSAAGGGSKSGKKPSWLKLR
ncbi:hypothetical protein JKP88DRAFT_98163 [Tribonema minus]|uniref:UBX domain-containing protein n=1 Tax=Tribonema minus TaxID=303371 RepID=A0A835YJ49_9STRA|nr:hypothetical protein JKP88DRAFT_98163 [Tribonema minus]